MVVRLIVTTVAGFDVYLVGHLAWSAVVFLQQKSMQEVHQYEWLNVSCFAFYWYSWDFISCSVWIGLGWLGSSAEGLFQDLHNWLFTAFSFLESSISRSWMKVLQAICKEQLPHREEYEKLGAKNYRYINIYTASSTISERELKIYTKECSWRPLS